MAATKWTDEYYKAFNREVQYLRSFWPGIPDEKIQFYAERITDIRFGLESLPESQSAS